MVRARVVSAVTRATGLSGGEGLPLLSQRGAYAGRVMRTAFAYTSARILLFVVSTILLYLVGARGFLLLALAFLVSAIASYVLLSRQRDRMSEVLSRRVARGQRRVSRFRARLEEGARMEDDDTAATREAATKAASKATEAATEPASADVTAD
jgi:Protein of unknown function (DUF4229)